MCVEREVGGRCVVLKTDNVDYSDVYACSHGLSTFMSCVRMLEISD